MISLMHHGDAYEVLEMYEPDDRVVLLLRRDDHVYAAPCTIVNIGRRISVNVWEAGPMILDPRGPAGCTDGVELLNVGEMY